MSAISAAIQRAVQANADGLEAFAAGNAERATELLRLAYRLHPDELGILVNLGLAFMQRGLVEPAEHCYRLAVRSPELRVQRSAAKNLGFLKLWCGAWQEGWHWHGQRFRGEAFLGTQWKGEPLNGRPVTVWNDVGMGDAFQFVRYTQPLVERGERVVLAVERSQIALLREQLAWPLADVIDRSVVDRSAGPHIPLMSLIGLLDPSTSWGRSFQGPTFIAPPSPAHPKAIGLCWASNPNDRTMHAYKSCTAERLLELQQATAGEPLSLQTNETAAHERLKLEPAVPDWQHSWGQLGRCRRVLSVDTAVAHLSAGSGIPLTLLLGPVPDWRWQQPQAGLWYPQLELASLTP